jgi:hypothetical protein
MIDFDEMKSPDLSVYISSSSSEFLIILIHNKIIKAVYSTDLNKLEIYIFKINKNKNRV